MDTSKMKPAWTEKLEPFLREDTVLSAHIAILHGNVDDWVFVGLDPYPRKLLDYLRVLFEDFQVAYYHLGEQIQRQREEEPESPNASAEQDPTPHRAGTNGIQAREERYRRMTEEVRRQQRSETAPSATEALRELTRLLERTDVKTLVIVDHLEKIALARTEFPDDREAIACLEGWTQNPKIGHSRNLAILLARNLNRVAMELRERAACLTVEIPLPSDEERIGFLRCCYHELKLVHRKELKVSFRLSEMEEVFRRYNLRLADIHRLASHAINEETELDVMFVRRGMTSGTITRGFSDIPHEELFALPDRIKQVVIGQDEAADTICDQLIQRRAGLVEAGRPVGVFLLVGPTGVGKTALGKALAQEVFGSEQAMLRIDMSEYRESHTVSKLIGAPPGYVGYEEGGRLTQAIADKPESLMLLDEVEKAHTDIFNVFLQVFDDGRLTDSSTGKTVDFTQTLILMTSNAGVQQAQDEEDPETRKEIILSVLRQMFAPEFLNRLDGIVYFNGLSPEICRQIVEKELSTLTATLSKTRTIQMDFTPEAIEFILDRGFNPEYGARPLQRTIERRIVVPLSKELLGGAIPSGHTIIAGVEQEELVFRTVMPAEEREEGSEGDAHDDG